MNSNFNIVDTNVVDNKNDAYLYALIYSTGILGGLASVLYLIYEYVLKAITQKFISQITINSDDPLFSFMLEYLKENGIMKSGLTNLTATLKRQLKSNRYWDDNSDFNMDKSKPTVNFSPGSGLHYLIYNGISIWIMQQEGQTITVGFERKPQKQQVLTLSCYGAQNVGILKQLCIEAMENNINKEKGLVSIYVAHEWGIGWKKVQSKQPRPLESVVLDSNLADEIVADLKQFQSNQKWYHERGVPYRRGYLLYGPPGTGKTSFINAISGHMKLNLCSLNLSGGLSDDLLNDLLSQTPIDSMILLEDVDSIFVERTSVSSGDQKKSGVSFSGLLNALDGVRSSEGRILFMTTNHREKLDQALMRPGRIDMQIHLKNASQMQTEQLFKRFFHANLKEAKEFAKNIPEGKISMAALQGHFLKYKDDAQKCLKNQKELFEFNQTFNQEMKIEEWLHRLSLDQYIYAFKQENINRIADLSLVDDGFLEAMNIKQKNHKKCILNMINGVSDEVLSFSYMNSSSARALLNNYVQNAKDLDNLLKSYTDGCMTEAQIRAQIFPYTEKQKKIDIQTRFQQRIEYNKQFKEGKVTFQPITQIECKFSVTDFMKSIGLEEFNQKLESEEMLDSEIFLARDTTEFKDLLEIKKYAQVFKFTQEHTKIKKMYLDQNIDEIERFEQQLLRFK